MKKFIQTLTWVVVAAIAINLLQGCTSPQQDSETTVPAADSGQLFEASDLEVGYDETSTTEITCLDDAVQIDGSGAEATDGVVTITQGGVYIFSGTLSGQLLVRAEKQQVQLVLDNICVTCPDGPALLIEEAEKVLILLAEDSVNSLTDSQTYTLDAGEDEPNACLYSKADLTINGAGTLHVTGRYNHGIYCKDMLSITGGTFSIDAVNDGVKGKDGVKILTADMTIEAGGDGIQSNRDDDVNLGYISIGGGTFQITAALDGIQAETTLEISGGTFQVTSGGGSSNAVVQSNGEQNPNWGQWPNPMGNGGIADETDTSDSAKGLKAGTAVLISGGVFELDASDDAVHSNGTMDISGGNFTISTGDDGFHSDGALSISAGTIQIHTSYEGIEGLSIAISGGDLTVSASDDGLNAAGGSDGSMGFDRDFFAEGSDSDCFIRISGGTLTIAAQGDGIDSNGALYLEGGTVYISGPTSSANSALDYGSTAEITGGTIVAVGSAGMASGFTSGSSQYSFLTAFASVVSAGTELTVTDSDGNILCSYMPVQDYQSLVISTPELIAGECYTITAGEQTTKVTLTDIVTNSGGMIGAMEGFGDRPGGMTPPNGVQPHDIPPDDGDDARNF